MISPIVSRFFSYLVTRRVHHASPGSLRAFRATRSQKKVPEPSSGALSVWRKRQARRVIIGVGLFSFAYKISAACIPLVGGDAADDGALIVVDSPPPLNLPPVLRQFVIAWDASDRLARVVFTVAAIVADYRAAPRGAGVDWSAVHQRSANRLLRLCRVNQGVYIKLAQHLAQLDHLLPAQAR